MACVLTLITSRGVVTTEETAPPAQAERASSLNDSCGDMALGSSQTNDPRPRPGTSARFANFLRVFSALDVRLPTALQVLQVLSFFRILCTPSSLLSLPVYVLLAYLLGEEQKEEGEGVVFSLSLSPI